MSSKNGGMNPEERFNYIEAVLAEIVEIQRETTNTMRQQAKVLKAHAQAIVEHDERIIERDERMDRIERHLEVLIQITDGLIRESGKKRRRPGSSG